MTLAADALAIACHRTYKEDNTMMTIGLLQESSTTMDISWLVWVLLAIFVLMVFLGWWASSRLPKEDETVSLPGGEHAGHEEPTLNQDE